MKKTLEIENNIEDTSSYVQVNEIENLLGEFLKMPYKVCFSLQPYIDVMNSKMGGACEFTKSALYPIIEGSQKHLTSCSSDEAHSMLKDEHFQTVMTLITPSVLFSSDLSFVSPPFEKHFIVKTPAFEKLVESDDWVVDIGSQNLMDGYNKNIYFAGIHILNTVYGQKIPNADWEIYKMRHKKTNLEKYYKINVKLDFVKVRTLKEPPPLSKAQINLLLRNSHDSELWLKHLPTDTFQLEGFSVGNLFDITDIQVMSQLKEWVTFGGDKMPEEFRAELANFIRNFLGQKDISIGTLMLTNDPLYKNAAASLTGTTKLDKLLNEDKKGIYDHLFNSKKVLFIEDLKDLENPSKAEKMLIKNKINSVVLVPFLDDQNNIIAFMEMGSKTAGTFNSFNVRKLQEVFEQLKFGFEKFNEELVNRVTAIIQNNFTSIHPSVSWKFQEVAKIYSAQKQEGQTDIAFEPIVFKNVNPLYGQSDIVSSSTIRNKYIQEDLVANLRALLILINEWTRRHEFHLLESYEIKLNDILKDLEKEFVSTDESKIVNLIINEVHPLINKLVKRFPELKNKKYDDYFSLIDPHLGIIYNKRKDFEKSVNKLIMTISDFMEKDESKMQKILPHFFEKYKTDGVEYNIYLGQSILPTGKYHDDDLRNFRIWQLVNSCEISRLVHKTSSELDVPLKTAELIFVYNNPLSIRFRMDEKKFDVDGAYNVRYEILKKRIDKAIVKKTGERLTVSGKIAIVYLSESDKTEYMEYFNYLIDKNYIDSEIEDLELEKLQGAEGLKALRIKVKQQS